MATTTKPAQEKCAECGNRNGKSGVCQECGKCDTCCVHWDYESD